jgi:hypothetical protein
MNSNSFEKFANQLLENPEIHARFVNTLSMLEYMGARKILKSQPEPGITAQILAHAAEEIRHAQGFKKIALKMSAGKLNSYADEHLYCGPEARRYFQSLDHGAAEIMNSPRYKDAKGDTLWKNYLITTLLIEERANSVYPVYETTLSRAGFPGVLSGIVREEILHLEEMQDHLKDQDISADHLKQLKQLEESAFSEFLNALIDSISS